MNYDIDDFNKDGTLTPGTFLIIVSIYISRYLLFGPISLIASRRGFSGGGKMDLSFLTNVSPFEMLSSIPAVLLLFLIVRRNSKSPAYLKFTWRHGRILLILSLLVQLIIKLANTITEQQLTIPSAVFITLDTFLLYYLATSTRPRDVFSMFPEDTPPGKNEE